MNQRYYSGVTRDTSGDEMARALAELAPPPAPPIEPTPAALLSLWKQRDAIKSLVEQAARVGKWHAELMRAPRHEREMARALYGSSITLHAHLQDIENLAQRSAEGAPGARQTNSGGGG